MHRVDCRRRMRSEDPPLTKAQFRVPVSCFGVGHSFPRGRPGPGSRVVLDARSPAPNPATGLNPDPRRRPPPRATLLVAGHGASARGGSRRPAGIGPAPAAAAFKRASALCCWQNRLGCNCKAQRPRPNLTRMTGNRGCALSYERGIVEDVGSRHRDRTRPGFQAPQPTWP
jgi:hypothetical protein